MTDATQRELDPATRFRRRVIALLVAILVATIAGAVAITVVLANAAGDAGRRAAVDECDRKYSPADTAYWLCVERADS